MRFTESLADLALLLARVGLGVVFVAHGWQKFLTLGLGRVAEQFAAIGIPQPEVTAAVVAGVELVGGAALLAGIRGLPAPAERWNPSQHGQNETGRLDA